MSLYFGEVGIILFDNTDFQESRIWDDDGMAYAETYSLCCIVSKGLIMFYG
jgi:hypothetical protein